MNPKELADYVDWVNTDPEIKAGKTYWETWKEIKEKESSKRNKGDLSEWW